MNSISFRTARSRSSLSVQKLGASVLMIGLALFRLGQRWCPFDEGIRTLC